MRVVILATDQARMVHLARELDALGHRVTLLTALTRRETRELGLVDRAYRGLGVLGRDATFDRAAAVLLPRCDVLVAADASYTRTLARGKKRGARCLIVRPSGVERDGTLTPLLPATSLDGFRETAPPVAGVPRVMAISADGPDRGADALWAAWRQIGGDAELVLLSAHRSRAPHDTAQGVRALGPLSAHERAWQLAAARVLCVAGAAPRAAERAIEALACGLRVVATEASGVACLVDVARDGAIAVVPDGDVDALAVALRDALQAEDPPGQPRDRLGSGRTQLSWAAWGARWDRLIRAD